jgi:hypothetical protein
MLGFFAHCCLAALHRLIKILNRFLPVKSESIVVDVVVDNSRHPIANNPIFVRTEAGSKEAVVDL